MTPEEQAAAIIARHFPNVTRQYAALEAEIAAALRAERERAANILDEAERQYWVAGETCHDQSEIAHIRAMEAECCRLAAAIRKGEEP